MKQEQIFRWKTKQPDKFRWWVIVNGITLLRIIGAVGLLLLSPMSVVFFSIYLIVGITDILDGWLARKMDVVSEFGARLDSLSDLLFYAVMIIKIYPILWERLPMPIWYAVAGILILRLLGYGIVAIKFHCFAALHTWLNKLTGVAVFLLPYILTISSGVLYCSLSCVIAYAAVLEEMSIHLGLKRFSGNREESET